MADTVKKADAPVEAASRSLKYMGAADVKIIPAGWDAGGLLAEEVRPKKEVVFDKSNGWVADLAAAGWDDAAVDELAAESDFREVTGLKRLPASLGDQLWRGVTGRSLTEGQVLPDGPDTQHGAVNADGTATPGTTSFTSGSTGTSGGTPTLGGSGTD